MCRLLLDPYVLALPAGGVDETATEYATRLLGLSELRDLGLCDFLLTNRAGEVLDRTGSFPLWDGLGEFATGYRADILRVVHGFLERITALEEAAGVVDILVDGCIAEPCSHLADRAPEFVQAYHRTFALAYVMEGCESGALQDTVVVTHGVRAEVLEELRDSGRVELVEWMNPEDGRAGIQLPLEFSICAQGTDRASTLTLACDPGDAWGRGLFREAVDLAVIQREARGRSPGGHQWPRHGRPWLMGPAFRASVEGLRIEQDARLLRGVLDACADTVLENALGRTHRLRIAQSGGAPARVRPRDGAVAWRRDVTHEIHLHYWSTSGGPELACVVPHNDFGIPE